MSKTWLTSFDYAIQAYIVWSRRSNGGETMSLRMLSIVCPWIKSDLMMSRDERLTLSHPCLLINRRIGKTCNIYCHSFYFRVYQELSECQVLFKLPFFRVSIPRLVMASSAWSTHPGYPYLFYGSHYFRRFLCLKCQSWSMTPPCTRLQPIVVTIPNRSIMIGKTHHKFFSLYMFVFSTIFTLPFLSMSLLWGSFRSLM